MRKTNFKKIKHLFGDLLIIVLLTFSIHISRGLPPKAMVFISKVVGTVAFYLFKKYRGRVVSNLLLAFRREKDLNEIEMIAREVFPHFTLTLLETVYAYSNPVERFLLKIKINGREYLDSALSQGKGVIALGAHWGPFTLLGARLSVEGYPFNLIINEGNLPRLWKRLEVYQRRLGQNPFSLKPITSSIKTSLNCLHRNEILYLIVDEQQRRGEFLSRSLVRQPSPPLARLSFPSEQAPLSCLCSS